MFKIDGSLLKRCHDSPPAALETGSKLVDEALNARLRDYRRVQSHDVTDLEISAEAAPTECGIAGDPERLLLGREQDDLARIEARTIRSTPAEGGALPRFQPWTNATT
jgi:hypothetical protein